MAAIGSPWSARELRTASAARARSASSSSSACTAAPVTSTSWRARNSSKASASQGSSATERPRSAPGRRANAEPTSGSHRTSSRSCSPSTPRTRVKRAGGGTSPSSTIDRHRSAAISRRADGCARNTRATASVSGTSSLSSCSRALARSASGTGPARVSRTHHPRPSWRIVRTWPIHRCSTPESQSTTSSSTVSSGYRSSTSATLIAAQSSAGADHSRLSQSKRRCGIVRTSSTRARS